MSLNKEDLKEVVSRDGHCFGCSQQNPYGLKMRFYTDETVLYSWLKIPTHLCGWNGIVHGGVLSTMQDEIMAWAGIYNLRRILMTKNINVEFLKPVYIENELRVEGRVIEQTGKREVVVEGKLFKNDDNTLCAQSRGTFSVFTAKAIKRMKIMPPEVLECFGDFLD